MFGRWQTIHAKLLITFLSGAIILLGMLLSYYYLLISAKEHAQQSMSQRWTEMELAENIYESILRAQKWPEYINAPKVIEFLVADALSHAEKFKIQDNTFNDPEIVRLAEQVIESIGNFKDAFDVLVTLYKARGVDEESGLLGATRRAAHELEEALDLIDHTPHKLELASYHYLSIRRHEKDYLTRRDNKYLNKLTRMLEALRQQIVSSSLPDKVPLLYFLDHYHDNFFKLVQQDRLFVEQTNFLDGKIYAVKKLCVQLIQHTKEKMTAQSTEIWTGLTHHIEVGLWVFITLIIFGLCLFGLLVNRTIVRPLLRLKQATIDFGQGKRDWSLTRQTADEIGDLVDAFQNMVVEIKRSQSELERARQAAEVANKAKSFFVANISHEIRTPMNAILNMASLCLHTETTPQQQDYLEKIHNAAHSLLHIINDVLDFSKIEAGKMVMEKISFHLDNVLSDLASLVTGKSLSKEVEIIFATARAVPRTLLGDPIRLGQVLLNLINNAIKFTPAGDITLSIERVDTKDAGVTLQFAIQDTGIGMTQEQLERLFLAFSQADNSTTRRYGGTGLGLVISKQLVAGMGGVMLVESKPGQGSTFTFTAHFGLPERNRRRSLQLPEDLKQKRVLIIDDNRSSQKMLRVALDSFSFQVVLASSGLEGLIELERWYQEGKPFDLLLLDWKMPGLSGLHVLQCIKSMAHVASLPILFMSPFVEQAAIRQAIELLDIPPPTVYLDKPVQISTLFDTVMQLFGKQIALPLREEKRFALSLQPNEAIRGARVLLVEDNEINQQVGQALLHMAGVVVETVGDGEEAVRRVASGAEFELILMDLQLPILDGYEATRLIRALPQGATLPIVAMTANVMVQDLARCWESGMDDHIAKPVDPKKLFFALNKWIKSKDRTTLLPKPSVASTLQLDQVGAGSDPTVPALHLQSGLAYVAGNATLYRSLLEAFIEKHAQGIIEIERAVSQGEMERARRLVHTLKGVTGTIGAARLSRLLAEWEAALANNPDPGKSYKPAALEEAFTTVLAAVKQVVATLPGKPEIPHPTTAPVELALLLQTLEMLLPHVEKRRPKPCEPILAQLRQMNCPAHLASELDTMIHLIQKYKMKEAMPILNALIARLQKS